MKKQVSSMDRDTQAQSFDEEKPLAISVSVVVTSAAKQYWRHEVLQPSYTIRLALYTGSSDGDTEHGAMVSVMRELRSMAEQIASGCIHTAQHEFSGSGAARITAQILLSLLRSDYNRSMQIRCGSSAPRDGTQLGQEAYFRDREFPGRSFQKVERLTMSESTAIQREHIKRLHDYVDHLESASHRENIAAQIALVEDALKCPRASVRPRDSRAATLYCQSCRRNPFDMSENSYERTEAGARLSHQSVRKLMAEWPSEPSSIQPREPSSFASRGWIDDENTSHQMMVVDGTTS